MKYKSIRLYQLPSEADVLFPVFDLSGYCYLRYPSISNMNIFFCLAVLYYVDVLCKRETMGDFVLVSICSYIGHTKQDVEASVQVATHKSIAQAHMQADHARNIRRGEMGQIHVSPRNYDGEIYQDYYL